jgi:hypothetical protein
MIMASRTKVIIALIVLFVASKVQVGADVEKEDQDTVSGIACAFTSIRNLVTPSNPNQSIKRLRGGKHRRLQGGEDNTNNNVTSRVSQYQADAYDNNSTADEWPEYDNNSTTGNWPDGTDNFDHNSTANNSEDKDDVQKWLDSLDPAVRILYTALVVGLLAAIVVGIFVSLYCCCGISPCHLAACACASLCCLLEVLDDRPVRYYY